MRTRFSSQECHPVEEEERPQYISRNDTNSNRSELIIAGKKLINAYDLLAGFCRGAHIDPVKATFRRIDSLSLGNQLEIEKPEVARRISRQFAKKRERERENEGEGTMIGKEVEEGQEYKEEVEEPGESLQRHL